MTGEPRGGFIVWGGLGGGEEGGGEEVLEGFGSVGGIPRFVLGEC